MSVHLTLIAFKNTINVKLNTLLDILQMNKSFSYNYDDDFMEFAQFFDLSNVDDLFASLYKNN